MLHCINAVPSGGGAPVTHVSLHARTHVLTVSLTDSLLSLERGSRYHFHLITAFFFKGGDLLNTAGKTGEIHDWVEQSFSF